MPRYTFVLKGEGPSSDIRWTYLPTDDAALNFARNLVRNVRTDRRHQPEPGLHMIVMNGHGREVGILSVFGAS
jgi:hypothetical protein